MVTTGCLDDDSSSGSAFSTPLYAVNGTIVSPVTNAPLSGIKCTLAADEAGAVYSSPDAGTSAFIGSLMQTAVTDAKGAYLFSGVKAGKYKIISSGANLVPMTTKFSVKSDTKQVIRQVSKDEWPKLAGNGVPYDPAQAYITVHTDAFPMLSAGSEDSGVTVELKKNTQGPAAPYEARGHVTVGGTVDWTASKTFDNGLTFFKGVAPNQPHTITAQKDGYSFESAADAMAAPGEITHYILAGALPPNGFPVTVVNNSGYATSEIFVAITGQNKAGEYYYYDPAVKDMVIGTTDSSGTKWSFPIDKLDKATLENRFVYTHPFNNMSGGRIWIFFKKAGIFGINKNAGGSYDAKLMVQPDHKNAFKDVIFDKIELTCDGTNVTSNTTIVDYLSIAFNLKPAAGSEKGFSLTSNDEIANAFIARGGDWAKCVYKDGKGNIIRIISPRDMPEFSNYLDTAIKKGWDYYKNNKITFKYSDWTYESYTTQENKLAFKVIKDWGAVKASGKEFVIDYIPPTKVVWDCDGYPLKNTTEIALANLNACICAALNRGVFCTSDWGKTENFYKTTTDNDGKYNVFAQILHEKAINSLVYGFPYDDHFGKDPTMTISYDNAKKGVTLTIPKMPAYIK